MSRPVALTSHGSRRCSLIPALAVAILLVSVPPISRAQLQWGVDGVGGNGTWNATNANWWDGSDNVTWNGGVAVFSGTPGVVTSLFPGQTAAGLVFNVPGYALQGGTINGSATGLRITTNADASITSTLSRNPSAPILHKDGAGVLTVAGTNLFDTVQIDAGEYRVARFSSLFFSNVVLADAPGVAVTLAGDFSSTSLKSLSGGGPVGGIVQPDTQARTLTATIFASGTFGGRLQDNGSGKLAVTAFGRTTIQTLTGANTHSGSTQASSGTVLFSGSGSALNSPIEVGISGTVRLENTAAAVADRVSDLLDLSVESGTFEVLGNNSVAVEEKAGVLRYSGAAKISVVQPGSAATQLTFAGLSRVNRGTLDVSGPGVTWSGIATASGALVGAHVTAGTEWATLGSDGRISTLTTYASDINAAGASDDVKLSGGGTFPLASDLTRNSLNLQNSTATAGVLDLSGHTLTLTSGGVLSSGSSAAEIVSGTMRAAGSELVVTNRNALTVGADIHEAVAGTRLTKSGAGVLTLTGSNRFSGNVAVNEGGLVVASDASLGTGSVVEFNGGSLTAAGSFASSKGFRMGTSLVGTIDTGAHDLSFSGRNLAAIAKQGVGRLTLTHPDAGTLYLQAGTLVLPAPATGEVVLGGGTLQAQGTLGRLELQAASRLDIGGLAPATLTTDEFETVRGRNAKLTIDFGIGDNGSDLWRIGRPVTSGPDAPGSILFDFDNLGGLRTGTPYTLITVSRFIPASTFGLAPNLVSAGWQATFMSQPDSVQVQFSQIPEPSAAMLLLACSGVLGLTRARPSRSSERD